MVSAPNSRTQVHLAFGRTGLPVTLPPGPQYQILETRSAQPLTDLPTSLTDALDFPIAGAGLEELAKGKKSAAISVCDITRPAPNPTTLPPLLERLHRGGISRDNITILIATGLHRAATTDEIEKIAGSQIAKAYRIVNHDARDLRSHRFLGHTKQMTPTYIDERFVAADLHITLGFIEQHLMAGFSGGRKLVAPGLAAQETIKFLHSPKFMRAPKAVEGSLADNPLHAELVEIASLARHDFMLDVALTRMREIAGIFAGEPVAAHSEGVRFVTETLLEQLPDPVDAVITTAAGYPLDLTFYQTIKGVTAAQHIVKPGGKILVFGECGEGAGAREFTDKLGQLIDFQSFLDQLDRAPVEVDQWQLEKLALAGRKFEVLFYTPGVRREQCGSLAANMFDTPEHALDALVSGLPPHARVAVLPEGPYVFAQVAEPPGVRSSR